MWLGIGFFGVVGLALVISLINFLGEDAVISPQVESPTPTIAQAPSNLQEHQQLVSDVVSDLDREVLIGDSPTLGNPDAEIVLLEFSDFQCPYCARAKEQVGTFITENEDDVLLVFKNFPLTRIHAEALPSALAAWAAGQQGQFWAYHDALFENQASLGEDLYISIAEDLNLDMEQFSRDRASEAGKAAIARDLALANEFQLNSTPTFIMDELLIPGAVPAEFFSEALSRLQAAE
jgi:protein-disulfide isomerase